MVRKLSHEIIMHYIFYSYSCAILTFENIPSSLWTLVLIVDYLYFFKYYFMLHCS